MSQRILLNMDLLLLYHKWVFTWGKFWNDSGETVFDVQMAAGNQEVSVPLALIEDSESVALTFGSFVMGPHPNDLDDALLFYYLINQPVLYVDSSGVSAAQIADQFFVRGGRLEGIFTYYFQQSFSFRA